MKMQCMDGRAGPTGTVIDVVSKDTAAMYAAKKWAIPIKTDDEPTEDVKIEPKVESPSARRTARLAKGPRA